MLHPTCTFNTQLMVFLLVFGNFASVTVTSSSFTFPNANSMNWTLYIFCVVVHLVQFLFIISLHTLSSIDALNSISLLCKTLPYFRLKSRFFGNENVFPNNNHTNFIYRMCWHKTRCFQCIYSVKRESTWLHQRIIHRKK